jgi:cell wall-associated NlpC family hydrolase
MRILLSSLAASAALALPAASVAAPPPAIAAKAAQAKAVLAQVDALDTQFGRVVDEWDGARIELQATQKRLAANAAALARARKQSSVADRRLGKRLVAIYEGATPGAIDVLAGATSMSDVIDAVEVANDVSAADRRVAVQARQARQRLAAARKALRTTEAANRATVARLASQRAQIGSMLARRRKLLASVQGELATMRAAEARRQRLLAAQAKARLARERAAALAAARAKAAEQARLRAAAEHAAETTSVATTTAPAPTTSSVAETTTSTPTTTVAPPVPSAGHADAASIALRYLGVPYRWGGATPSGFDCSGLVMYVYAQLGIQLPHYTEAQYGYGTPVPRDQLQPGDLVFFDGLSHVGIYIGNGQMVHAPHTGDVVKIAPLSELSYVGARRL